MPHWSQWCRLEKGKEWTEIWTEGGEKAKREKREKERLGHHLSSWLQDDVKTAARAGDKSDDEWAADVHPSSWRICSAGIVYRCWHLKGGEAERKKKKECYLGVRQNTADAEWWGRRTQYNKMLADLKLTVWTQKSKQMPLKQSLWTERDTATSFSIEYTMQLPLLDFYCNEL